ncbi:MAG: hypothetical protein HS101_12890 [Planctomycetia bacterium]|jgi:hypothetical protein|nr:hypothetical protein [Planctomycetia bacterium]MCC7313212.1 hypothetical protein [Planctomycetota bacterium]OQZ02350.1 MAG: hypothetical protein B6D36_13415 [Planctomycetes bacterium UTPLA1]
MNVRRATILVIVSGLLSVGTAVNLGAFVGTPVVVIVSPERRTIAYCLCFFALIVAAIVLVLTILASRRFGGQRSARPSGHVHPLTVATLLCWIVGQSAAIVVLKAGVSSFTVAGDVQVSTSRWQEYPGSGVTFRLIEQPGVPLVVYVRSGYEDEIQRAFETEGITLMRTFK